MDINYITDRSLLKACKLSSTTCSELKIIKEQILVLMEQPQQIDILIQLLENTYADIENYSAITNDDARLLMTGRCKAFLLKGEQSIDREDKKLAFKKAVDCGRDMCINQSDFIDSYCLITKAFIKLASLVDYDAVFSSEDERIFSNHILELGHKVIILCRTGLRLYFPQSGIIYSLITELLNITYWTTDDFVEGEVGNQLTAKEASELISTRQKLINSGKVDYLNRKAIELIEKVNASTNTHLRNKKYQLRIQVLNFRPHIWRRVKVPGSITLQTLQDRIISPVLGWCRNYHAYYFRKIPFESNTKMDDGLLQPNIVFGPIHTQVSDKLHKEYEFKHNIHMADDSKVELYQLLEKVSSYTYS